MPKSNSLDATLEAFASAIADRLNQALDSAMKESLDNINRAKGGRAAGPTKGTSPKRGPGRPAKTDAKPCLVPKCGKKTVAKGLCQGHYRKAVRLKLKKFDAAGLAKLLADGRATRWAKKK